MSNKYRQENILVSAAKQRIPGIVKSKVNAPDSIKVDDQDEKMITSYYDHIITSYERGDTDENETQSTQNKNNSVTTRNRIFFRKS